MSTKPTQTTPDVEATIAQLRELTDAILDYAKHADAVQLNTVERTLRALADYHRRFGGFLFRRATTG